MLGLRNYESNEKGKQELYKQMNKRFEKKETQGHVTMVVVTQHATSW